MMSSGKNVTPPQLLKKERETLLELCDKSLADVVKLMGVKIILLLVLGNLQRKELRRL